MELWPVIACDQFTSQPEYWEAVRREVGDAPSSYHLILPEADLGTAGPARVEGINGMMRRYLDDGIFKEYPNSYIYVERTLLDGSIRKGLIGAVDLEAYDYHEGAALPIRATEQTVTERIPPRKAIRQNALLELSHVLMLCDDPERTLIEPLGEIKASLSRAYSIDLMMGGGHINGWVVQGEAAAAFEERLERHAARHPGGEGTPPQLAVGDGNHSLATAKACYEALKAGSPGQDFSRHPARYTMVELENIHDPSLKFEPVHRVLTNVDVRGVLRSLQGLCDGDGYPIRWTSNGESGTLILDRSRGSLPLGVLQPGLDAYLASHPGSIDYIHGEDALERLASEPGAIGFQLPPIEKDSLFRWIANDGMLPRKTFSMGHAREKRYYLEARRITASGRRQG